jgi:hypothetical protein
MPTKISVIILYALCVRTSISDIILNNDLEYEHSPALVNPINKDLNSVKKIKFNAKILNDYYETQKRVCGFNCINYLHTLN